MKACHWYAGVGDESFRKRKRLAGEEKTEEEEEEEEGEECAGEEKGGEKEETPTRRGSSWENDCSSVFGFDGQPAPSAFKTLHFKMLVLAPSPVLSPSRAGGGLV